MVMGVPPGHESFFKKYFRTPLLTNDTIIARENNKTTRKRICIEERNKGNGSLLKRRGVNGLVKVLKDYLKNMIKGDSGRKVSKLKVVQNQCRNLLKSFSMRDN